MGSRKFGWHSGTVTAQDGKFKGDLYVQDDIVFSDVSAGVLGVTGGIEFTGTLATGISFNGATFVPDASRTDIALEVGSRAAELTVTMAASASQNFDPVQFNVNIAGVNPTNASTVNLIYANITHDTAAMSFLRLKCADWNIDVQKNLQDAYVYQGEIDYTTNAVTISGESAVMSLNMNCASTVTGDVRGLIVNMHGAGLANSSSIGIEVRTDGGSATLDEGIRIWSVGANTITAGLLFTGTLTYFANFDGCSGAATTITTDSGSAATTWKARIKVKTDDGTDGWINVYSTSNE